MMGPPDGIALAISPEMRGFRPGAPPAPHRGTMNDTGADSSLDSREIVDVTVGKLPTAGIRPSERDRCPAPLDFPSARS